MTERAPIGVIVKTYPKLSETFVLEEILGLEHAGHRMHLFSLQHPTDDWVNPETRLVKAPVHYLSSKNLRGCVRESLSNPERFAQAVATAARLNEPQRLERLAQAVGLAGECRRLGLRSLHAHFISQPASVAQLAALLAGIPFSISAHAKDIYLSSDRSLRQKLGAAHFTVTCTEHNRRHLEALAPDPGRVHSVHHGVALERFASAAGHHIDPADDGQPPLIIAVGRLRPKKGFDVLIQACATLRDRGVSFRCRIIGYGPEEDDLSKLIERLNLSDHVELPGKKTRAEVIEDYRRAAVMAQPCRVTADGDRDGIPNVLLEAMAMRLPVISTPVSGIPELISDDDNGLLVPSDAPNLLADAIASVLGDRNLAQRLGRSARETIESFFTVDRSVAQISRLLDSSPHTASVAKSSGDRTDTSGDRARIGYVLKGYPRLSEIFIASEIHRVEQLGTPLRLFVIKPPSETTSHDVVSRVQAKPEHLPPMTPISRRPAWRWFAENLPSYGPPVARVAAANPKGFGRAAREASAQSMRARKGRWPRKLYLKEFFQAASIADKTLADPALTHLHAHFGHGATTVTWLAALMSGRTFSFTGHAKDIYREELNPAGLLARKMRAATFVATCTDANRSHLAVIEPTANVQRIYHGLNDDFTRLLAETPKVEQPPAHHRRLNVLAVGRLVPKKGLDVLVDACALLVERGVDVRVRIVGEDGEHSEALRSSIFRHGLEKRIELVGAMRQDELFREYRAADVFCLPCRVLDDGDRDGIPNVLLEAMASGLAVVSTPVSGIPELIEDRVNGVFVEPDEPESLAKTLTELHEDGEFRQKLARAGSATVAAHFDAWTEVRALVDLLTVSALSGEGLSGAALPGNGR